MTLRLVASHGIGTVLDGLEFQLMCMAYGGLRTSVVCLGRHHLHGLVQVATSFCKTH